MAPIFYFYFYFFLISDSVLLNYLRNFYIGNEGFDKWEVGERETQGIGKLSEAKNVNDVFRGSTPKRMDLSSPGVGLAPETKPL